MKRKKPRYRQGLNFKPKPIAQYLYAVCIAKMRSISAKPLYNEGETLHYSHIYQMAGVNVVTANKNCVRTGKAKSGNFIPHSKTVK